MYDLILRGGKIYDGSGGAPFVADVAVSDGKIAAIGETISGEAAREIACAGLMVTPGWVDVHTHYDGQATWDPYLAPSSLHGVTTVVAGNCGVGFAPAAPERRAWLIELMEAIEDIPGTALTEGIKWEWETFPEYLDALDKKSFAIDFATQVPHGAVRAYVMGDRGAANETPTTDEISQMSAIVKEGIEAGALGFSTSRTFMHRHKDGEVMVGTTAEREELMGFGRAMAEGGHGVFEMASDFSPAEDELDWMRELAIETGNPVSYALIQWPWDANQWRDILKANKAAKAEGADLTAQVSARPTGLILGWQTSAHPFKWHQAYMDIEHLSFEEQRPFFQDPAFRERLVTEKAIIPENDGNAVILDLMTTQFENMYNLLTEDGLDYEPTAAQSIRAMSESSNRTPQEIAYDMLMEEGGKGYIYMPMLNYTDGNLDHIYEMFQDPNTHIGLGDGGAHCGIICDASFPTYLLAYWARDRTRGPKITVEKAVEMHSSRTADVYGLRDRGRIAVGLKADFNVIDFDNLNVLPPYIAFDLPANGKRMMQDATGYRYTIVSGEVIYQDGKATGALPGKLIRGRQEGPGSLAAE